MYSNKKTAFMAWSIFALLGACTSEAQNPPATVNVKPLTIGSASDCPNQPEGKKFPSLVLQYPSTFFEATSLENISKPVASKYFPTATCAYRYVYTGSGGAYSVDVDNDGKLKPSSNVFQVVGLSNSQIPAKLGYYALLSSGEPKKVASFVAGDRDFLGQRAVTLVGPGAGVLGNGGTDGGNGSGGGDVNNYSGRAMISASMTSFWSFPQAFSSSSQGMDGNKNLVFRKIFDPKVDWTQDKNMIAYSKYKIPVKLAFTHAFVFADKVEFDKFVNDCSQCSVYHHGNL